jgi:hypothetical protein
MAGCGGVDVGGIPPPEGVYPSRHLDLEYEAALAASENQGPLLSPCALGGLTSPGGYVVALSPWAEAAGLRPGDRITAIAGRPAASPEARARALLEVPPGGPLRISVDRHGQDLSLTLPCREQLELWVARRRLRQAIARAEWDGCIAAAQQVIMEQGFAGSVNLASQLNCLHAKDRALGRPFSQAEADLAYQWARQRIRESQYVPGSTEEARREVARVIAELRKWGFTAQANELGASLP